MCRRVLDGKGSVHKRHVAAVKKSIRNMRGLCWSGWEFGVGGAVDAMEGDFAIVVITKGTAIDAQPERHGVLE